MTHPEWCALLFSGTALLPPRRSAGTGNGGPQRHEIPASTAREPTAEPVRPHGGASGS